MKYLSPILMFALLFSSTAYADTTPQRDLLRNSTYVLEEIMSAPDVEIPEGLISNAKAIIVFPTMLKAGFLGAVRYGKGVVSVRDTKTGQWGPPSFVTTIGGSFGFQIGVQAVDLVLLVMTERGVKGLLKNNFTLGGDLAVTAGPVGRHAEAGFDILFQGDAYSYSRSKGVFAGISVKGTVIKPNFDYNKGYYQQDLTPLQIMTTGALKKIPESSKRFIRDFNRMAPMKAKKDNDEIARLDRKVRSASAQPVARTVATTSADTSKKAPLW